MYIYFGGSYGKESSSNADLGLIPGSERSLGEGNGYPLQYHCLENSMDRGAWWATSAGLQRIRQDWATNTFTFIYILNNKICREKRYIIGANGHFYNDHKIIYSICICGCDMCVCITFIKKKKIWPHHVACGILVPHQWLNPHPLHWKHEVKTTGLSGKSQYHFYFSLNYAFPLPLALVELFSQWSDQPFIPRSSKLFCVLCHA